jgi:hypothetical protein
LRSGKNNFSEGLPRESPRLTKINKNGSDACEQTPNIYPTQTEGHKSHGSAAAHQDGKDALVELVWKHFAEEITEILREVHADFALNQPGAESSPNRKINFA